jgi:hypothetical protein
MRTDGRTDVTKLIVAFRNFVNAPNKIGRYQLEQKDDEVAYINSLQWLVIGIRPWML